MRFSTGLESQTMRGARLELNEVTGGPPVECSLSLFLVKQFQQQNEDVSSAFLKAGRFFLPSVSKTITLSMIPPFLITSLCTIYVSFSPPPLPIISLSFHISALKGGDAILLVIIINLKKRENPKMDFCFT